MSHKEEPKNERIYTPFELSFREALMTSGLQRIERRRRVEHEKDCFECQHRDEIHEFQSETIKLQLAFYSNKELPKEEPKPETVSENTQNNS